MICLLIDSPISFTNDISSILFTYLRVWVVLAQIISDCSCAPNHESRGRIVSGLLTKLGRTKTIPSTSRTGWTHYFEIRSLCVLFLGKMDRRMLQEQRHHTEPEAGLEHGHRHGLSFVGTARSFSRSLCRRPPSQCPTRTWKQNAAVDVALHPGCLYRSSCLASRWLSLKGCKAE